MARRKPKVTLADILGDDAFVELPSDDTAKVARKPAPVQRTKRGALLSGAFGLAFRLGLSLCALAVFAFPTFLLTVVGMAPTFVAILVSHQPDRRRLQAVAAFNLSGVVPFLLSLWLDGHGTGHAVRILSDINSWAVMYSAAAAGFGALWLGPHVAAAVLNAIASNRRRILDSLRVALVDEWGVGILPDDEPVRTQTKPNPSVKARRPDAA